MAENTFALHILDIYHKLNLLQQNFVFQLKNFDNLVFCDNFAIACESVIRCLWDVVDTPK